MSIVITTPTGQIGSKLTEKLLEAGARVTLLARDADKVAGFAARGAAVRQGSLEDEAFVVKATRGASALFWLTPPNVQAADLRSFQRRLGAIAAKAISANRIERVVNLSSVGAHLAKGVGPVSGLHDVEQAINAVAVDVTHLRPGSFMENVLMSLDSIKSAGSMFLPLSGSVKLPMVATRDIAAAADRVLRDPGWSGKRAVHLYGPRELSYEDVADTLSRVLGRPITFVNVSPEQAREALLGKGISADVVGQFLEMYDAFNSGRVSKGLPARPELRGETTFEEFARSVIRPLVG